MDSETVKSNTVDPETDNRLMEIGQYLRDIDPEIPIDALGHHLLLKAIDGDTPTIGVTLPQYWEELKNEFKVFICTTDKKYADLRRKLSSSAFKSQTAIVSTISAAMTAQFGVVSGLLVPFVAMCLVVLARTGKEAFCATLQWDAPLKRKANTEPKKG